MPESLLEEVPGSALDSARDVAVVMNFCMILMGCKLINCASHTSLQRSQDCLPKRRR